MKSNKNISLSKATSERYPLYLRVAKKLKADGRDRTSSIELAELLNINASTVRRDFTFLKTKQMLGRQGSGYKVDVLIDVFTKCLGVTKEEPIILLGVGNLGNALLKYNHWIDKSGKIVAAFDAQPIADAKADIPVYNVNDIEKYFPKGCRLAILTIDQDLQATVDKLMDLGVTGFIDFTREYFEVREDVQVRYVDVVSSIQSLITYLDDQK